MTATMNKTQEQNLNAARKEAREALASAEQSDVQARYKVAVIACKVKDEAKYGANALEEIGEELGLGDKTLYRYAKVAEAWTEKEFGEMSKVPNARGIPLTWSHYELIATLEERDARAAMIRRVLDACHSARALRFEMMTSKLESKEAKPHPKDATPKAAIKEFTSLVKIIGSVGKNVATWEKKSLPALKASRDQLSEKSRASLRDAQKRLEEIKSTLDRLGEEVEGVLDSRQETTSTVTADAA